MNKHRIAIAMVLATTLLGCGNDEPQRKTLDEPTKAKIQTWSAGMCVCVSEADPRACSNAVDTALEPFVWPIEQELDSQSEDWWKTVKGRGQECRDTIWNNK